MGSLSPSTARRESCDSKQSPSAQLFVPQRLDHLKPNGAAGGKNGGADRDCHGRDETAQDMPYFVRCPAALLAPTLQVIHGVIATFLIKQSGLKPRQANMGAVTLIQRFGSAANLNIHLHCLVLDGVYLNCDGAAIFHEAAAPSTDELEAVLLKIITRTMHQLTRLGLSPPTWTKSSKVRSLPTSRSSNR